MAWRVYVGVGFSSMQQLIISFVDFKNFEDSQGATQCVNSLRRSEGPIENHMILYIRSIKSFLLTERKKLKAVIYDCDGTLVVSEEWWRVSQIDLFSNYFKLFFYLNYIYVRQIQLLANFERIQSKKQKEKRPHFPTILFYKNIKIPK